MKASDLFVRCLEAEGIQRIFGVPGEENADFMISLEDSDIEFVLCRHEQGAAFMAEAHGRLTGEVGVCLGTLGPGATNLITGVADANMDIRPRAVWSRAWSTLSKFFTAVGCHANQGIAMFAIDSLKQVRARRRLFYGVGCCGCVCLSVA